MRCFWRYVVVAYILDLTDPMQDKYGHIALILKKFHWNLIESLIQVKYDCFTLNQLELLFYPIAFKNLKLLILIRATTDCLKVKNRSALHPHFMTKKKIMMCWTLNFEIIRALNNKASFFFTIFLTSFFMV